MTKEFFNKAMNFIDQSLIDEYYTVKHARASRKRKATVKWISIAAALILIAAMTFPAIGIIRGILSGEQNLPAPGTWIVTQNGDKVIQKKMTSEAGVVYMMNINYTDQSLQSLKSAKISPVDDIGAQLYGQWLISLGTCDYSLHFELFQKELLEITVYKDFTELGLTPEEANKKIRQVASDVTGIKDCSVDYVVTDIKINDAETVEYYRTKWDSLRISDYISSFDEIEAFATYFVEDNALYYSNYFYIDDIDFGEYDMVCYKYKGNWYVDSDYLDDDLSIDLVSSQPGNGSYYKERTASGIVESIESGYIKLEGSNNYYLLPDDLSDISIGEQITLYYYSVGMECKKISDNSRCKLGKIYSINPTDSETNSILTRASCYVVYVTTNGFVADLEDIGRVFVAYSGNDPEIELFDTAMIEYETKYLKKESGTYTGIAGGQESYSYVLY